MKIRVLRTVVEVGKVVGRILAANQTIGVVPTMGALHAGHLSLVEAAIKEADVVIATIFLNPTQFAPHEDLGAYPQTLAADLEQLEQVGCHYVFAPESVEEMYPSGCTTTIKPPHLAIKLEGEFRPSHFGGVTTVVLKLLNITRAHYAYFGQKDFQQAAVIRQMVSDLNVPTVVRVCPIVRDPDGLAMSSRNVYLSAEERQIALSLNRTLDRVEELVAGGLRDGFELITEMRQLLIDSGVDRVDYATIADLVTLSTIEQVEGDFVALVAGFVGKTRLIDNRIVRL